MRLLRSAQAGLVDVMYCVDRASVVYGLLTSILPPLVGLLLISLGLGLLLLAVRKRGES